MLVVHSSRARISDRSYSHMTRLRHICRFDCIESKVTRIGIGGILMMHQPCGSILFRCNLLNLIWVNVSILVVACVLLRMMLVILCGIVLTLKTSRNVRLRKCGIRCRIFSWIVSLGEASISWSWLIVACIFVVILIQILVAMGFAIAQIAAWVMLKILVLHFSKES